MLDDIRVLLMANPRGQYASWLQLGLSDILEMDMEMFLHFLESQIEHIQNVDAMMSSRGNG